MPPLIIGLTGGMGAGKSTVAAFLEKHGASIISGDQLGRAAVESSPQMLEAIRSRFGADVFAEDGKLDRRALGDRVFASWSEWSWLTETTFPLINARWQQAVQSCKSAVIVFDAALIFEWQIENQFDLLIVTTSSPEIARKRLIQSSRFTEMDLSNRLIRQLAPEHKAQRADVVIYNNGTLENLSQIVHQLWNQSIIPLIQRKHHPIT